MSEPPAPPPVPLPEGISPARQRLVLGVFTATAVLLLGSLVLGVLLARRQVARSQAGKGAQRPGPNFLVIAFDSLSPARLASWGAPRAPTPALDRLAGEGVRFSRAYAPSSQTDASVAALFSGRPVGCHQGKDWPPGTTLPEVLRARGYTTAVLMGAPGAEDFYGLSDRLDFFRAEGLIGRKFSRLLGSAREPHVSSTILAEQADRFVRKNSRRPFFLYIHFDDTRVPYGSARNRARSRYFQGDEAGHAALLGALEKRPCELTAGEISQAADLYDDALTAADAQISILLDLLEETRLREDTVVIVTGARGESLGESGCVGGGAALSEEEIRVPLVIGLPRGKAGLVPPENPVSLLDLAPTLARLAGAAPAPPWTGRDLSACLATLDCPAYGGIWTARNERASGNQEMAWIEGTWKFFRGTDDRVYSINPSSLEESAADDGKDPPKHQLAKALEEAQAACR